MSYTETQHYGIVALKQLAHKVGRVPRPDEFIVELPHYKYEVLFGSYDNFLKAAGLHVTQNAKPAIEPRAPRLLVFDIECSPIIAQVWGLFDQNIGQDMILKDWSLISVAAKFVGKPEIYYSDTSKCADHRNDELLVLWIYELLSQADVLIGQNSIRFDIKKLNGKFEEYGLPPLKPVRHIDLLRIKKKHFALTSNKLAFSAEKFNTEYKKLSHGKFPGFSLWNECLSGNQEAWEEMREYNIHDVLATEELYERLKKHDSTINYGVYSGEFGCCPKCGHSELDECSIEYTKTAAYQTFRCKKCQGVSSSRENLIKKSVRAGLLK